MPTRSAFLLALLLLLPITAAAAEAATIRIHEIAIDYDPERWIATRLSNGGVRFDCRGNDCQLGRVKGHGVTVNARFAGMGAPPDDMQEETDHMVRDTVPMWSDGPFREPSPRDFGGIAFTGYLMHSRCRAYTPTMRYAFGTYRDRDYVFAAGFNFGCGGIEGVSQERFQELLEGVRLMAGDGK